MFYVIFNSQECLVLDAAVLFHAEKVEIADESCPRRLLKGL
jgi:hypothetical protein